MEPWKRVEPPAVQILACIALIRSSDPSVRAKLTLDDGAAEFIDGEA